MDKKEKEKIEKVSEEDKEKRKERIIDLLLQLEEELKEIEIEDMRGASDKEKWERWGRFHVYFGQITNITFALDFMWFFPDKMKTVDVVGQ